MICPTDGDGPKVGIKFREMWLEDVIASGGEGSFDAVLPRGEPEG